MDEPSTHSVDRPHRLDFRTRDVDEYMAILSKLHAPVRADPLDASPFMIECSSVMSAGICMSRANCANGVNLAFASTFDGYGLSLLNSGSFELSLSGKESLQATAGGGLMIDSGSTLRAVMGPGTRLPRIAVTSEELHGRLADLMDQPVVRRVHFLPHISSESPVARMARTLTDLIYEGMEGDAPLLHFPVALASLRDAVLNLILEGVPHSYTDRINRRVPLPTPRNVKRAMEFMSANAASPIRLADIARAAGTSPRALQTGFMRFRGVTPMEYLRGIRLRGARADLMSARPGTTVAGTAYAWGFPHLSTFSTRYVRAFGEKPSVTLQRAMRP